MSQELEITNAAGVCKALSHVEEMAESAATGIVVGGITYHKREQNPGVVFWHGDAGTGFLGPTLNTLGLPNPGAEYYRESLPEMVRIAHLAGKVFSVNIAGFSLKENVALAILAKDAGVDRIELNAGCPNVWSGGEQKRILAYNPPELFKTIRAVHDAVETPLDLKLSPYEPYLLGSIARRLGKLKRGTVRAVVASNTFPNGLAFDEFGRSEITFGDGFAGVAGSAVLHQHLGQVQQFRNALPGHIKVIGVGGIDRGKHVHDYFLAGADGGVQVGSTCYIKGPRIFSGILQEYADMDAFAGTAA